MRKRATTTTTNSIGAQLCRALLDPLHDAVLIIEGNSLRIVEANKRAVEFYGYRYEDLVGMEVAKITGDVSDIAETLADGQMREKESIHVAKSGLPAKVLSSTSLIEFEGQRAVLNVVRDMDEHHRVNSAIEARERRFRSLVENNSDILALVDERGTFQFVSQSVEHVLGFASSDLLGRNVFDFVNPEDRARAQAEYMRTVQQPGEAPPSVLRFKESSGGWIPFEIVANNQLQDPHIMGVIFTARDLRFRKEVQEAVRRTNRDLDKRVEERTMELAQANATMRIENQERRYAEKMLQESLSVLKSTLEATADGILVVSTDRQIKTYNQKFLELWKIPASAMAKFSEQELLLAVAIELEDPQAFLHNVNDLYGKPEAESYDTLRFKDGRVFERYSHPQRLNGDEIVGRVWSFRDVTQTLRMESELHQAKKMEAIGQLAGGVAHDFNNLLMLISGNTAQILEQSGLPGSVRTSCEEITQAAKRGASLTRQLLAFSRKQPLTRTAVDLNKIVTEMERMLKSLFVGETQVNIQVSQQPIVVCGDPSQVELMILNLAINARDAMPAGGVLSIRTGEEVIAGKDDRNTVESEFALLEVSDTGYGMSQEIQAHIFEPFYTTKEIGRGTGLGLSAVYGIVQQAGGHISVQSEPSRGSTFRVYLPKMDTTGEGIRVVPDKPAPSANGRETILLVEDESGIRTMTRVYLEGLGYKVLEAANGPEALRIAEMYPATINLLVSDVMMPGMKGGVLAEILRKQRQTLKILFITGYADTNHLKLGIPLLEKPFSFATLGEKVRSILDELTKFPKEDEAA
ncbi:MAG: hypothetical protein JWO13_2759 [Acidobacteriales bacterium]|nr:hypothetical protein [Terriglobales bacterium]